MEPGGADATLVDQFRRSGLDVYSFLSQHEDKSIDERCQVVLADLQHRALSGEPVRVDEYFSRCPEIVERPALKLRLVVAEYQCRQRLGESPSLDDYLNRFPDLAARLEEALAATCVPLPGTDFDAAAHAETVKRSKSPEADTSLSGAETEQPRPGRLRAGETFGDYLIEDEIARGGMGVVYRATQISLNRPVALKMILSSQLASQDEIRRFHSEAESAAKLDHPGIVPIHEVGEVDGQHFFSMGLVEGGSLAGVLGDGPLEGRRAAELVKTIAESVQYAHTRNIVHRDLKPANILLGDDGQPKVTDFGLAKNVDEGPGLTLTGQVLGTPGYMAPEQAAGRIDEVGPLADVYALGAILYFLVTGRAPHKRSNIVETLQSVLNEEPTSPRQLNPRIDLDVTTICLKCLEKLPGRRYASAAELVEELQRYLNHVPIEARPIGRVESWLRWGRRKPLQAAFAATVSIALLAMVGFFVGRNYQRQLESINTSLEESLAETERARAAEEKQRIAAVTAQRNAERLQEELDQLLYFRRISLAHAEWEQNEVVRARELLESCPERFRHWEWHFLWNLSHPDVVEKSFAELDWRPGFELALCISSDNRTVAYKGRHGVHLWDAATNAELRSFPFWDSNMQMTFSPDGERLACSTQESVKVWETATGEEVLSIDALELRALGHHIVFSPDGSRLFVSGRIWQIETGESTLIYTDESIGSRGYFGASFTPEGSQIVIATRVDPMGRRHTLDLIVHDVATGSELSRTRWGEHNWNVSTVAFSPDCEWLAVGGHEGSVRLVHIASGRLVTEWRGHTGGVRSLAFSNDGGRIVTASADRLIKVWRTESREEIVTLRGHTDEVGEAVFDSDGRRVVSIGNDGMIRVWDLSQPPVVMRRWQSGSETVISRAGDRVAVAETTVFVWDTQTGIEQLALNAGRECSSVDFSPDGNLIAARCNGGIIRIWDALTGREVNTLHGDMVRFSPDGNAIATVDESTLTIFDVETCGEICHCDDVGLLYSMSFSPDGGRLLVSSNGGVCVLDTSTGGRVLELTYSRDNLTMSSAYSPDGTRIATGSYEGAIRMWDADGGEVVSQLSGHSGPIMALAFSPDGQRLVSGGVDRRVRVWDTATGHEILILHGHLNQVNSVSFSGDGRRLLTASGGSFRIWDAGSDAHFALDPQVSVPRDQDLDRRWAEWFVGHSVPIEVVTGDGAPHQAETLAQLPAESFRFHAVRSSDHPMTSAQAAEFCRVHASFIDLGNAAFGETAAMRLAENPELVQLYLHGPENDADAIAFIGEVRQLERLGLWYTGVGDDGLASLAGLDALAVLHLAGTGLNGAGLSHLAELPALRTLNLKRTGINDDHISHLVDLASLESLDLSENEITDVGLAELANHPKLARLYLANTRVTGDGVRALDKVHTLGYLDLTGTRIEPDAIAELRERRTGITVVGP